MSYSFNRFLKTLNESDTKIKIYDNRNYPVYTINPFSILQTYVSGNNLCVVTDGNRMIVLDFFNKDESSAALVKLQSYIDIIKQRATVVNPGNWYIYDAILSPGISYFNGSTASVQNILTSGDNNIDIKITNTGDYLNSTTHKIELNWTGVLPIERGGLNNTDFMPNQILTTNNDSDTIVSSGYNFDDTGVGLGDIWSADRIIKQINSTHVNKEKPYGLVDGKNRVFLLTYEPIIGSEHLYLNGLLQDSEYDMDYIISGNRITFIEAPMLGSKLRCSYMILKKNK